MADYLTLNGRTKNVAIARYLIDWEAKSLSKFQKGVKDFLRPYWSTAVVCEEFPCAGTRYTLDLVNINDRIAIEVQGAGHLGPSLGFFHKGSLSNYRAQLKRDLKKAKWCEINGFKLVEVLPDDLPLTPAFFLERYDIHL